MHVTFFQPKILCSKHLQVQLFFLMEWIYHSSNIHRLKNIWVVSSLLLLWIALLFICMLLIFFSQWVNWIMSYIDLASCWEKLRGEASWALLESLTCSLTFLSQYWCPIFSPLVSSISSKILAPNPLVTAQASEDETWYSGKNCCRLDHLQNAVAQRISFPGFPGLS